MAVMSKFLLATSALVALVSGAPLDVRSASTSVVVETVWQTVDINLTVWVDENGKPISTEVGSLVPQRIPVRTSATTTATIANIAVTTTTTTTAPAAAFYAPTTPTAAPAVTSDPAVAQQVAPASSSSAAPAPVQSDTTSNVVPKAGTSTGTCEGPSNACSGDITYYEGGLGACGWNVNTATDMAIALPHEFMGTQSNGNPYCGRKLTIKNPNTGLTVDATVGDKCMGCTGRSIDLTDVLFKAVGGGCDGRCSGFDWWFTS